MVWVECCKGEIRWESVGRSKMNRIAQPKWTFASQRSRSLGTPSIEWNNVKIIPCESEGVFEVGPCVLFIGEAIDRRECLGECKSRCSDD